MSDLISRRKAFEYFVTLWECIGTIMDRDEWEDVCMTTANEIPSAQPTLRERALMLLLNWAVECDFGYDNFPEEYERYKNEIEDMSYLDGMIYIAEKEVERREE